MSVHQAKVRTNEFLWSLFADAYSIINANSKFQKQWADPIFNLGIKHLGMVRQLVNFVRNSLLIQFVVKSVDDLLISGINSEVERFLKYFNKKFL